ncbi:NTP transferase domain-containing protein [bacterium]|nr:NTP transferase domain-containing protein [bacterium]
MITQAVILASGLGSRLTKGGDSSPKSLMPVAGMPLISRVITILQQAGIKKIVVVVGYKKEMVETFLEEQHPEVFTVENSEYRKSNGLSLLAAKPLLDNQKPFVLTMVDHIFEDGWGVAFLEKAEAQLKGNGAVLATDADIDGVFDLDDATKVFVEEQKITHIGKGLQAYNCIDTGMFLCRWTIFKAIEATKKKTGDASISDGMSALIESGKFSFVDMTGMLWQDVDTPGMKKEAENRLLEFSRSSEERSAVAQFFDMIGRVTVLNIFSFESVTPQVVAQLFVFLQVVLVTAAGFFRMPLATIVILFITLLSFSVLRIMLSVVPKGERVKKKFMRFVPALLTVSMLPVAMSASPLAAGILMTLLSLYSLIIIAGIKDPLLDKMVLIRSQLSFLSWEYFWIFASIYLLLPLPLWPLLLIFTIALPLTGE